AHLRAVLQGAAVCGGRDSRAAPDRGAWRGGDSGAATAAPAHAGADVAPVREGPMKSKSVWHATVLTLLALMGAARAVHAATRRAAVVGANTAGAADYPPLQYAEGDAGTLSAALVELGGVEPADLFLLQGRSLAALKEVLELAKNKVAAWHKNPDTRVVLMFYFSGHSDGEALELGHDRLGF